MSIAPLAMENEPVPLPAVWMVNGVGTSYKKVTEAAGEMSPEASTLCTDRIFAPGNGVNVNDQLEAWPAPVVTPAILVMKLVTKILV